MAGLPVRAHEAGGAGEEAAPAQVDDASHFAASAADLMAARNALVGAAAADVARHGVDNLLVSRHGRLCEKGGGLHDLAGLAVAALRDVAGFPGALNGMGAVGAQALDRDDLMASASARAVVQERTAWPTRWTVQAPQAPMPQPNFVPVKPTMSRMAQSRGICGSASISCGVPLIRRIVMVILLCLERQMSARPGQRLEIGDKVLPIGVARNAERHGRSVNQARGPANHLSSVALSQVRCAFFRAGEYLKPSTLPLARPKIPASVGPNLFAPGVVPWHDAQRAAKVRWPAT
jgi:hypothetical protein